MVRWRYNTLSAFLFVRDTQGVALARIFISYRHDDAAAWAGRLYDRLADHFGDGQVFMDISDIPLGLDFRQVIEGEWDRARS